MSTFTQLASDNFHRANEEPLNPANWTVNTNPTDLEPLAVLSDVCVGSAASFSGTEYYTSVLFPDNQQASATINQIGANGQVDLYIQGDLSALFGYAGSIAGQGGVFSAFLTDIGNAFIYPSVSISTPQAGDVFSVAIIDTTLALLYNGVTLTTASVISYSYSRLIGMTVSDAATQSGTSVSLFTAGSPGVPTSGTVYPGIYGGSNLTTAFSNPHGFDLMQVVNEGGEIVWNLNSVGNANRNPINPTLNSILGKFSGSSFVTAFPNPNKLDILQVISEGGHIVFGVDAQGYSYAA